MTDLYDEQHAGLVAVHQALAEAFGPLAAGAKQSLKTLIPQARGAVGFLLAHHEMEDSVLFPRLRKAGRLRSTDVAFLDARDADHKAIHALCDALSATLGAQHPHAATIAAQSSELLAVLVPHTREEELGLAPARMREMIDQRAFTAMLAELEARRAEAIKRLGGVPKGVR